MTKCTLSEDAHREVITAVWIQCNISVLWHLQFSHLHDAEETMRQSYTNVLRSAPHLQMSKVLDSDTYVWCAEPVHAVFSFFAF